MVRTLGGSVCAVMLCVSGFTRGVAKNGIVAISSPCTPSSGMCREPAVSVRYRVVVSCAALVCCAGHMRKNTRTFGASWLRSRSRTLATAKLNSRCPAPSVGARVSASGASFGSIASKSAPSAGWVFRLVSTCRMKDVAAALAVPVVPRVAPNRLPPSVTWNTRMSMLVYHSTFLAGSPCRMYGSGDFSRVRIPLFATVEPAAVRVAVSVRSSVGPAKPNMDASANDSA
jgi:hypothetical protein